MCRAGRNLLKYVSSHAYRRTAHTILTNNMEQYQTRADGFKEVRKALLNRTIPIVLLGVLGALAINYFNPNLQRQHLLVAMPLIIPIIAGAVGIGIYRLLQRQKEIYNSYRLTIDEHSITREQHNTPTIRIHITDVDRIIKNHNGSFTIKADTVRNVIVVPSQVDNYDDLERSLARIKPITKKTREPFSKRYLGLIAVLPIALMAAVYLSNNKIIVGVSGTILVLGYSFYEIRRNKNTDDKTRKAVLWLLPVAASIIMIMYYKLTGSYN